MDYENSEVNEGMIMGEDDCQDDLQKFLNW
jgi:hypothetical protein